MAFGLGTDLHWYLQLSGIVKYIIMKQYRFEIPNNLTNNIPIQVSLMLNVHTRLIRYVNLYVDCRTPSISNYYFMSFDK